MKRHPLTTVIPASAVFGGVPDGSLAAGKETQVT